MKKVIASSSDNHNSTLPHRALRQEQASAEELGENHIEIAKPIEPSSIKSSPIQPLIERLTNDDGLDAPDHNCVESTPPVKTDYTPFELQTVQYKPIEDMPVYGSRTVRINDIIDTLLSYDHTVDEFMIQKAYVLAATAHQGMLRRSGEPYLTHPLAVAAILCDMKMDDATVVSGLLHDTVEDTEVTVEDIRKEFGDTVARIVDGVTKISKVQGITPTEREATNLRKMTLAMLTDLRVIMVKLADRLNNMRTLGFMPPEKQRSIARETLDIFTPLASILGIHKIQAELEDLALFYLEPQAYDNLRQALSEGRNERQKFVAEVKEYLSTKMSEFGIKAEIEGRPKHIYSVWRKMKIQNLPFEQIYDLVAFRIIVEKVQDCYAALGFIHLIFKPIPGRLKDYISLPKLNGYQSLHTAVVGLNNIRMEIQIRTREMHSYAEEGVAAHWRYKDGDRISDVETQRINNLKSALSWQQNLNDPDDFLSTVKEALAPKDMIYVFTPNRDVKELPAGATPIDFAYSVHTSIGNSCSGAKVNNVMCGLHHKLENGDTVEILTSRSANPTRDWLRHTVSPKAKSRIRQWLLAEERKQAVEFGRALLIQEMRRHKLGRHRLTDEVLASLGFKTLDELNMAVAYGKIKLLNVLAAMKPELKISTKTLEKEPAKSTVVTAPRPADSVLVSGVQDVFVRYAKCCTPVPGEPIVGFLSQGKGVTIHTSVCKSLAGLDRERLVEVSWVKDRSEDVNWDIYFKVKFRPSHGALGRLVATISERSVDILEAHTNDVKEGLVSFRISVTDYRQYTETVTSLNALRGLVELVERYYPGEQDGQGDF
jgi:GTP pyrophosphokinase